MNSNNGLMRAVRRELGQAFEWGRHAGVSTILSTKSQIIDEGNLQIMAAINDVYSQPAASDLFTDIAEWQRATFPTGTLDGARNHLFEEVEELRMAFEDEDMENIVEEAADVLFLLIAVCSHHGIDLPTEARKKLEINKARTWAKVPGGYSKHVEDTP